MEIDYDEWQAANNRIGTQLSALFEQIHGTDMAFILIIPPPGDEGMAQLVTNVNSVKFIKKTLQKLEESLEKVAKLRVAANTVQ